MVTFTVSTVLERPSSKVFVVLSVSLIFLPPSPVSVVSRINECSLEGGQEGAEPNPARKWQPTRPSKASVQACKQGIRVMGVPTYDGGGRARCRNRAEIILRQHQTRQFKTPSVNEPHGAVEYLKFGEAINANVGGTGGTAGPAPQNASDRKSVV